MVGQLFKHKELIWELTLRDLKLRYRKPLLGFLWMLIIPLCTAGIYKILFSDFFRCSSGEYPFFIHLITAIFPWAYFSSSIQSSTNSILGSKNIIQQVPFPRKLLPISTVCANLINFLPTILVLGGFFLAFKVDFSAMIIFLPLVILLQTGMIIGLSLLVAGLQVIYRDVEYIIQVFLMALFFLIPGVYTLNDLISRTSPLFTKIYLLNPLVGIANLYRITLMGGYLSNLPQEVNFLNTVISPCFWTVVIWGAGFSMFRKCERRFSDYLNV
ncbi:MAG: ABC transporter permease [Candidatus Omnitrophica bacterium]|nr:ABC transporter permease [Candidatus Omnitrophota bacterium]MBU0999504.1 ABC transporter permease [Patescibacteria group bacterium]MBU1809754.1 ABC transporter permease [Candidatus Omnitrophota bacterium]MBU2634798.1 ABC transporter permease [Nanoarchaeota archaeon]